VVHRVGTNITQYKRKGHTGKYWFDDQCREKRKLIREALPTHRSRNDKNSTRKYLERGMRYSRIVEEKRNGKIKRNIDLIIQ
jgi:P2-related tail formation protein